MVFRVDFKIVSDNTKSLLWRFFHRKRLFNISQTKVKLHENNCFIEWRCENMPPFLLLIKEL